MAVFDECFQIGVPVGLVCDFFFRVTLLAGPFEEGAEVVGVNIADFHFLPESTAIEGGGVDVVVPHQVQVIDVFDGD
nr:hypothetical protein [Haloarchaeobius amylolyticus]